MIGWIIISVVVLIIALVLIIPEFNKNKNVGKMIVPPNSPNVVNYTKTQFTHGHKSGRIIRMKENKNKTVLIEYIPDDQVEGDDVKTEAKSERVIVLKENLKPVKGFNSRDTIHIVSKHITDYPQSMRDSMDVKWATTEAIKSHLETSLGKVMLENSDKAIEELLKDWNRSGLTQITLEKIKEEKKKIEEINNPKEEEK